MLNLNNKYVVWYNNICARGQVRVLDGYTERHHIVPDSFYKVRNRKGNAGWLPGNSDAPENITRLTDREHELVHYLLTKIYKDDKRAYFKVLKAYEMRSIVNPKQEGKRHFSSRRLAGVLAERSRLQSELMSGAGNPFYGKTHTDEFKEKKRIQRLAQDCPRTGKHHSEDTKQVLREATKKQYEDGTLKEYLRQLAKKQYEDPLQRLRAGDANRGKFWYYDPATNHQKTFFENEVPNGYIKGRPFKSRTRKEA